MTAAAGLLLSLGLAAQAAPASAAATADQTASLTYPVNGSTVIKAVNSTLTLGPGSLAATVDLTTGALTANLTLPKATASFKEFGIIPVTATTELVPDGATTGTVNFSASSVTSTSSITLKLDSLKVAGIPLPVGPSCETRTPAAVSLTSGAGFNLLSGGTLSGTYTIPPFSHCGLNTALINLTIPGPGNTIALALGAAS
jgi:hypothetical protein